MMPHGGAGIDADYSRHAAPIHGAGTPSQGPGIDDSGMLDPRLRPGSGADESALPETRLKIYSDLFEEVIERDRVFGSLLRKIKTAYESVLCQGVPDLPEGPFGPDMSMGAEHPHDGPHSSEPTTRAEDSLAAKEMVRENHVLKE